jgi:4-cresol dehydrogenase (hydroxylating)
MNLSEGLTAWSELLGQEYVITESQQLQQGQTATFATSERILAILRPGSTEEVQQTVQIANHFGISLYPVSGGKNWGYGSRVPPRDGCVLLDLGRMNRVLDWNEELAYVTIEPGVTQGQLWEFLEKQGSRLWMDATGSSPESSIIGNIAERGFGHTPYGDRFAQICGLEVVLPTGDCIHTGMGRFENAESVSTYRWGLGPYIDGIFSQSNLGIITRMTFWLMPKPEHFEAFSFSIATDEQLPALIDALRPLRLDGTLRSAIHIGNTYKVLSSTSQYPWELTNGTTPLSPEILQQIATSRGYQAWSGLGGLYGSKPQVNAARQLLKKALKGKVDRLIFLDRCKIDLAEGLARVVPKLNGIDLATTLKVLKPVYYLLQGVPSGSFLDSAYWRKKTAVPEDANPDRDSCGLIWCAPVAPLDGKHGAKINQITVDTMLGYGFEPMISLTLLTERCLGCVISISYDREIPGEDERAMGCYQDLLEQLTNSGYYPYRIGIQSMSLMAKGEDSYQALLSRIKEALDPKQILAPGRYESLG